MSPRSVVKCAALALASFGLAATASIAKAQTTTDLVYEALSKDARGKGTAKLVKLYKCNVPPGPNGKSREMSKISLPISLDFIPHDCDEDLHSGTIRTTWAVLLRIGPAPAGGGFIPFGTHSGSGVYLDTVGNNIKLAFNGTVGCGTHRDPFMNCEKCREDLHFEGWVTGTFTAGPIYNTYIALGLPAPKIKASYSGQLLGKWPTPQAPTQGLEVQMMIDGVYIFNCGG